jgi:hypothetical protein
MNNSQTLQKHILIVDNLQDTEDMASCQIYVKLASEKYYTLIFHTTELDFVQLWEKDQA